MHAGGQTKESDIKTVEIKISENFETKLSRTERERPRKRRNENHLQHKIIAKALEFGCLKRSGSYRSIVIIVVVVSRIFSIVLMFVLGVSMSQELQKGFHFDVRKASETSTIS